MAFKVNTDRIIGLSAMLISLLTLFIFIYQTNIIRTQSRLSVTPRITFTDVQNTSDNDSLIYFESIIMNKGLGPAIIESINILHKNERYDLDIEALFQKVYPEIGQFGQVTQSYKITKGTALAAGEQIKLYTFLSEISKLPDLINYIGISEGNNPFKIEVKYSSIYGEEWITDNNRDDHPTKIN